MMCSDRQGFTLAELVVAGVILGLIATLCWPSMKEVSKRLIGNAEAERGTLAKRAEREAAARNGEVLPDAP